MSFGWDASHIEVIIINRLQIFLITFLLLICLGLIIFLPLFIALLKDLSLFQILSVVFATILGVWIFGFLLSIILHKKKQRRDKT